MYNCYSLININRKDEFGYLAVKFKDMIQGLRDRDFIRDIVWQFKGGLILECYQRRGFI